MDLNVYLRTDGVNRHNRTFCPTAADYTVFLSVHRTFSRTENKSEQIQGNWNHCNYFSSHAELIRRSSVSMYAADVHTQLFFLSQQEASKQMHKYV